MNFAAPTRWALAAALLAAPIAAAPQVDILAEVGLPKEAPQRGVLDLAGMLDDAARTQLENLAMSFKTGSGHEVLVVTVPTLKGRPIEDVALQIGRDWKLGAKDLSDAAVLLLARDEHGVRIEVGRGLEGTLTDAMCSRIIRTVIVPQFKQGDFAGGTIEGVKAIHAAAGGQYGDIPDEAPADETLAPIVALIVVALVFALVVGLSRAGRHGRGVFPFPMGFPLGGGMRMGGFGGGGFGGGGLGGFGGGGGGFGGFGGGGGGFSGGGASGHW